MAGKHAFPAMHGPYLPKHQQAAHDALSIDSEVANDPHSTANAAVPAGFAGLPPAERFISNLEIIRKIENPYSGKLEFPTVVILTIPTATTVAPKRNRERHS
jgi:hypothetical protein